VSHFDSMQTRLPWRSCAPTLILCLSLQASCLSPEPGRVGSPDEELAAVLEELRFERGGDFSEGRSPGEGNLVADLERLALVHPRHVPVLVANAAVAYEENDPVGAQKYLDQALALDPTSVPATLLRVRIAAEGGNLPYAQRKLREQLELAPDDPRLREALAGVLFLLGQYEEALVELDVAEHFLEEGERGGTDYHRGLIAEAMGRFEEARAYYLKSQGGEASADRATRRLRWLEALASTPEE